MTKIIGISISVSSDLGALGFGQPHLDDANIEIARLLLQQGYKLAYGGDLRKNSFTISLCELVNGYTPLNDKNSTFLHSYLGFPIGNDLDIDKESKYFGAVKFRKLPLPNDLKPMEVTEMFKDETSESRYYWFRSMTAMREKMNNDIDARVVLGGQSKGFKSKFSGIAEEVLLAMQAQKPVYLCGAFGGATKSIIEAITNGKSERLNLEYFKDDKKYLDAVTLYNSRHENDIVNYENLNTFFREKGIDGLNNGLTQEENKLLFETIHIPQMIALILKGLKSIS